MLNYKFRLYPTKEQESVLEQTLDGCRWMYNYFLSIPPMSEYDMNYAITELKEQHSWLRHYHSKMLQMVGKQVAAARKTAGGRLSYRTHDEFNAFIYNQSGFRIENNRHASDNNVIENPQFLTKMLKPLRRLTGECQEGGGQQ